MITQLHQVDRIEVVVLVDNYCDELLEDTLMVKRLRLPSPKAPMAEPGLSLLVKVFKNDNSHTILMDTGISGDCLQHNINLMPISKAVNERTVTADINDVESVVISHGHSDHFNGLNTFLKMHKKKVPIIVHPSAFVKRRFRHDNASCQSMISFDESTVKKLGAVMKKQDNPSTIASDLIFVSGKVERTNNFETGTLSLEAKIGDRWVTDPFYDDQSIAIHVKNKGLVVLSGCSHAGIINTVKYIQKVTGIDKIHAVMGGFHLPGPNMDRAKVTIMEMKRIAPDYIIPIHCTGWQAITLFSSQMPDQFILSSVGTTFLFNQNSKKI